MVLVVLITNSGSIKIFPKVAFKENNKVFYFLINRNQSIVNADFYLKFKRLKSISGS